jgi:hypothetical protein
MSSTLDTLKQIPVEQVQADLRRVRAERARLAKEQELLEQLLALHGAADESTNDLSKALSQATAAVGSAIGDKQVVAPAGTRRAAIQQIMSEQPEREWSPAEIIKALKERGSDAKPEGVRVLIRRMVERGQLERPGYGTYRLPSKDESRQTALDDGGSEE